MKEKRYSMPQGKKITKDQMQEGTDYYDGFYDLANIVEKNWSVKKIKEFLRDLIDSKLIYQIKIGDQVVLERIMLGNKVRKIDSKKWKKFFKNLQPAALTESGIKELTEFANSNSSVQNPPDISQYGEIEVVDEEVTTSEETSEEIGDATSEQIQESTKNKLLFEEYNLDTPENILSNTRIEKSRVISIDKELTEFLLKYWINRLWNLSFKKEKDTIKRINRIKNDGNKFHDSVLCTFKKEYQDVVNLKIPKNYAFINPKTKKSTPPNLMQRYIAYKVKKLPQFANFSEPGTGKSLSAALASRVINSKMTLILLPNSVVAQWKRKLIEYFPDSEVKIGSQIFSAKYDSKKFQYLILNYDKLNQSTYDERLKKLREKIRIELVIFDEVQYVKTRTIDTKKPRHRRDNTLALIGGIRKKNPTAKLLVLSATPILNQLTEGRSLLDLLFYPVQHTDVKTATNGPNAIMMFEKFSNISMRQRHGHKRPEPIEIEAVIKNPKISPKIINDPLTIETLLTKARIPYILNNIVGQTIIYTEYVGSYMDKTIVKMLSDALKKKKIKHDRYTGSQSSSSREAALQRFIGKTSTGDYKPQVQVLIASTPISVGVDGLQEICNRLIFNSLPWTYAQYEQIISRIDRQGQKKPVEIVHVNGKLVFTQGQSSRAVEYDKGMKLGLIKWKQTIADCAVDGIISPKMKNLATAKSATRELMKIIKRLDSGKESFIDRELIPVNLTPSLKRKILRETGNLTKIHAKMQISNSSTVHKRWIKDKTEFTNYHTLLNKDMEDWPYPPVPHWINRIKEFGNFLPIADFGCGPDAKIRKKIGARVKSFDMVSTSKEIIACNNLDVIKEKFIKPNEIGIAVYCLSLWNRDWREILKIGAKCVAKGGYFFITVNTSKLSTSLGASSNRKKDDLRNIIKRLGFEIEADDEHDRFTFIEARKL